MPLGAVGLLGVGATVGAEVGAALGEAVGTAVGEAVGAAVGGVVGAAVGVVLLVPLAILTSSGPKVHSSLEVHASPEFLPLDVQL